MMFTVRLLSACRRTEIIAGTSHFSTMVRAKDADALLCEWAPSEELLTFRGPKAWFCCEPTTSVIFKNPRWRHFKQVLRSSEFLYHVHPDEQYRVPHINIEGEVSLHCGENRRPKAIAVVSNTGGAPWRRSRDLGLRAGFATHARVDLYGSLASWKDFRSNVLSARCLPKNYIGSVDGFWTNPALISLMAEYKVAVCLENTQEPYYFTEKFVNAVQAGCVPVYRAHPTVRDTFLQGAIWVDPQRFDDDVTATLEYALREDIVAYRQRNRLWLNSEAALATTASAVFARIGGILMSRANNRVVRSA